MLPKMKQKKKLYLSEKKETNSLIKNNPGQYLSFVAILCYFTTLI